MADKPVSAAKAQRDLQDGGRLLGMAQTCIDRLSK